MKNIEYLFFILFIGVVGAFAYHSVTNTIKKQETPLQPMSGEASSLEYKIIKINSRYYIVTKVHYGYVIGPEVPTVNPTVSIQP